MRWVHDLESNARLHGLQICETGDVPKSSSQMVGDDEGLGYSLALVWAPLFKNSFF